MNDTHPHGNPDDTSDLTPLGKALIAQIQAQNAAIRGQLDSLAGAVRDVGRLVTIWTVALILVLVFGGQRGCGAGMAQERPPVASGR
ncbi:MAG: hypothetical protein L6R28_25850 [Planctomycetes bacterium]|nr:hypothetical protein [Planctomycetota bacterium]MCK6530996.1 hypothetical protein [Myxococcota bacterium]